MGKNSKWGGRALAIGALVLGAGVGAGVSDAASPDHHASLAPSVDVAFTPLVPAKTVLSGTIGANSVKQVVVSGGTTTVPTNATTIQMTVTSKGAQAGSLTFYPSGNPAGSSGQTVSWSAGGSGTATITTDVGQKNSVAFKNNSGATATVKATVTGWSTDVEADDVSSLGGSNGQVLTDTGAGAAWQNPQLPSAYFTRNANYTTLTPSVTTVASLVVPAGTYEVDATTSAYFQGTAGYFYCYLAGPTGPITGYRYGNVNSANIFNTTLTFNALVQTSGGTITLQCADVAPSTGEQVYERTILATRVGATSGAVVSRSGVPQRVGQPGR